VGTLVYGNGTATSTASGTRILAEDEFYANLTVPSGATLVTAGYRVFVNGTLTLAGTISDDGGAGGTGSAGVGAPAGTLGGGSNGGVNATGVAIAQSLGGQGGSGSASTGIVPTGGFAGGTVTPPTAAEGGPNLQFNTLAVLQGRTALWTPIQGGSGGGSGGTPGPAPGGGGGGGGVVVVAARSIVGTGSITANGGAGGTGGSDTFNAAGSGGGGGGGFVALITSTPAPTVTLSAAGGAGGPASGLGPLPGSPGLAGQTALFILA